MRPSLMRKPPARNSHLYTMCKDGMASHAGILPKQSPAVPGLVPPHDASTLAILPRKANGPAVRLGHSVDDQARHVPDNAGPLNFHSPTQKRAGLDTGWPSPCRAYMAVARSRSERASISAAASVLAPGLTPGRLSRLSLAPTANPQRVCWPPVDCCTCRDSSYPFCSRGMPDARRRAATLTNTEAGRA